MSYIITINIEKVISLEGDIENSMTDSLYYKNEEWINFRDSIKNNNLYFGSGIWLSDINKVNDWLNKNMFDYCGLIPKGLAIEAPKGMYKEE